MREKKVVNQLKRKISDTGFLDLIAKKEYCCSVRYPYKGLLEKHLKSKKRVIEYVKGYDFAAIIDEDSSPREDEIAKAYSIELAYFLIRAADKYGAKFVLEDLFSNSVFHKKYSKLNPLNWFLWIFNKIAWSEIKACPELESDEAFCRAIKSFQSFQLGSTRNLSKDEKTAFYKDLTLIVQRIAVQYRGVKKRDESEQASAPAAGAAPPPPPPPPKVKIPLASQTPEGGDLMRSIRNLDGMVQLKQVPKAERGDTKVKKTSAQSDPINPLRAKLRERSLATHGTDSDSEDDTATDDDWSDGSDNESVNVSNKVNVASKPFLFPRKGSMYSLSPETSDTPQPQPSGATPTAGRY